MADQSDERLAYEIERAINHSPEVNISDFRVRVTNGNAHIHGVVRSSQEKLAALQAARSVSGLLGVDDTIAVETPSDAADETEAQALNMAT